MSAVLLVAIGAQHKSKLDTLGTEQCLHNHDVTYLAPCTRRKLMMLVKVHGLVVLRQVPQQELWWAEIERRPCSLHVNSWPISRTR